MPVPTVLVGVWRDVLADGVSCGLHKIERLIHNPMPDGSGLAAAPTFEMANAPAPVPA